MPNFSASTFGVISRIATTPLAASHALRPARDGVHIDAIAVHYDQRAFLEPLPDALAGRLAGPPSYFSRIADGPDYPMAHARRLTDAMSRFPSSSRCSTRPPSIAAALTALAPFRARGAEVIVVDGGSRDRTVELAAPLADRVIAAPRGRAAQMNAGAAVARGDVLLFLHADTTLPPDADRLVLDGLRAIRRGWGRFDVRIEGRSPLLPAGRRPHELALARHRHRHRRPGDVRHARRRSTRPAAFPRLR